MEIEFKNLTNKSIKFPILLDFPLESIKDHIWFKSLSLEEKDSFKFQPKYINIIVEHKKKFYNVEKNKKILQLDKKRFDIENKKIDIIGKDQFYWIDGEKHNANKKFRKEQYKPLYIVDFLDDKDFDIATLKHEH